MTSQDDREEGTSSVSRVEAFSDGVIAIIITIMVLELRPPVEEGMAALLRLWPTFLAYILSYAYVAIYWVNHHRLFSHARAVTNSLVWSNMALLFTLSLLPFSTSYLGEHHFTREAAQLYLASLLPPALTYVWLQSAIRSSGLRTKAAHTYHRTTMRKGAVSSLLYSLGFSLSFLSPWLGIACAALVAVLWFLPASRIDRLFLCCDPRDHT